LKDDKNKNDNDQEMLTKDDSAARGNKFEGGNKKGKGVRSHSLGGGDPDEVFDFTNKGPDNKKLTK